MSDYGFTWTTSGELVPAIALHDKFAAAHVAWLKNRAGIAERLSDQKRSQGFMVEAEQWDGRAFAYRAAARRLNNR